MSIYILLEYVEECKKEGKEPNFKELHKWKKENWRD